MYEAAIENCLGVLSILHKKGGIGVVFERDEGAMECEGAQMKPSEAPAAEIGEALDDLFPSVHDERPMSCDGFLDG